MYTEEEMRAAKASLPKIVADFVDSSSVRATLAEIGKEVRLNLHEVDSLTQLVNATIAGLVPRTAFYGRLTEELPRVSSEHLEKIRHEVNEKVFKAIQARLHQPQEKKAE